MCSGHRGAVAALKRGQLGSCRRGREVRGQLAAIERAADRPIVNGGGPAGPRSEQDHRLDGVRDFDRTGRSVELVRRGEVGVQLVGVRGHTGPFEARERVSLGEAPGQRYREQRRGAVEAIGVVTPSRELEPESDRRGHRTRLERR